MLPAKAAGFEKEWPAVESICRVTRFRQGKKNGEWKNPGKEAGYLIASLPASESAPEALLSANRGHWGVEIMHRNHASKQGRHPRRARLHQPPRQRAGQHLLSHRVRPPGSKIRLEFAGESHRAVPGRQKQGSSAIFRMSLPLLLNRPASRWVAATGSRDVLFLN